MSFLKLMYLTLAMPFETRGNMIMALFNETTILLVSYNCFLLTDYTDYGETVWIVGYVVIFLSVFCILINTGYWLCLELSELYLFIKNVLKKKKCVLFR